MEMNIKNSGFDSMVNVSEGSNQSLNMKKSKIMSRLDDILSKYTPENLGFNETLVDVLRHLGRKRKEFDATRFFVLVVGPVKSGKSTLVNIFARKYVSPTAYKECTALPTIIGKSGGEHLNKIVQYVPTMPYNDDEAKKITFDYILDVIRGVEDQDVLNGRIYKKESELTTDNVKEIVTLYHDQTLTKDDLVVSMGIKGEGFIDDEIMLIDMPGLDGGLKHKDNTLVYSNMAQRADVVFFVQSTTSALNKDSIDFLNELFKGKEGKVPVWLIHNLHESQYFLYDDAKKQADIDEQVMLGRKRVEEGFGINRFKHIVLNLGKVYTCINEPDRIKAEYKEEIESEFHKYINIEQELISTLKSERQVIKDENNVGKAIDTINESIEVLDELIKKVSQEIDAIEADVETVREVLSRLDSVKVYNTGFLSKFDELRPAIASAWEVRIKEKIDSEISKLRGANMKISGQDLIEKICRVRNECMEIIPIGDGSNFRKELSDSLINSIVMPYEEKLDSIKKTLQDLLRLNESNIQMSAEINAAISRELKCKPHSFEFEPEYDLKDLKRRNRIGLKKYYDKLQHDEYMKSFAEYIIGEIPAKLAEYKDIIAEDFRIISNHYVSELKSSIDVYVKSFEDQYETIISQKKKQIDIMSEFKNDLSWK